VNQSTAQRPGGIQASITSLQNGAGSTTTTFQAGTHDTNREMIINGSGFGSTQGVIQFADANSGGATTITLSEPSDYISWNDNQIRIKIHRRAGTGDLEVWDENSINQLVTTPITIEWAELNVYSDHLSFSEVVRQNIHFIQRDPTCQGGILIYDDIHGPSGGFAGDIDARGAFERAIETWRCETFVNLSLHPGTTDVGLGNDDISIVMYNPDLPNGVLGRCNYWSYGAGNSSCNQFNTVWFLNEMDVQFAEVPGSLDWCFSGSCGFFEYDFESVALHEVGHGNGLGHVIDPNKTMHYAVSNGTEHRTLSSEEIEAGEFRINLSQSCYSSLGLTPMTLLNSSSCVISNIICTALPVELLQFQVQASNGASILNWSTATEQNNRHFIIQRSTNLQKWDDIGTIAGKGNSNQQLDYSFIDNNPQPGINFYRLKQVDWDGTFTYSPIQEVRFNEKGQFEVHPNPVQDGISRIQFPTDVDPEDAVTGKLLDASGRVIWEKQFRDQDFLDLAKLPQGSYFLQIVQERAVQTIRLIN
jgi:hypothetical protein